MPLAICPQWLFLLFRHQLHAAKEFLLASARDMECSITRLDIALNACPFRLFTQRTSLRRALATTDLRLEQRLTSFHRDLEIFSMCSIGSIKTWFCTVTSGIHIAQRRWAHFPEDVCLNAPPSLGQSIQVYRQSVICELLNS
jgi:hypothetical protein